MSTACMGQINDTHEPARTTSMRHHPTHNHARARRSHPTAMVIALMCGGVIAGSGCKLFSFTSTTAPDAAGPGPASIAEGDPNDPLHPTQMAKRTAATFLAFGGCDQRCGDHMRELAGISMTYHPGEMADIFPDMERGDTWRFNPKEWLDNPDPSWLTGWGELETGPTNANDVWEAMALAANRREWTRACHAKFEQIWSRQEQRQQVLAASLAEARALDDRYARVGALLRVREQATTPDEPMPRFEHVGVSYDVERTLMDDIREGNLERVFVAHELAHRDRAKMRPAYTNNDERDLFCGTAGGQPEADRPSNLDHVRPIVEGERLAELRARA
ncbi:MAG: hypothetical protein K0V04_12695, partial [Deltaproteobacteria bacterium]|nr:hypothetical protein [Deltaproteobacteria bacterium]